ncbi:HdeD family acid-resistance protein [Acuticoccus mangrovi]|uniref:DUF308 domain-containing protein n=1 Tax=Acuticoccus mangrovi TaxID=2796142 RepID=A0A934IN67_9HYPH|nr:DUF308 domain-containing protein [Acuticoccus mangrovi]MBJ3774474.1 DUF308 domain-containing protein [Acuticoccus mangrovi]
MSTDADPNTPPSIYAGLTMSWKWMLALGILMAVLGVIGLGMTYGLTIISVLWFGVLAIIGGIAQIIDAFKHAGWKSFIWHLLLGILYLAAGIVLVVLPVQSAWWLTLFIGAMFVVNGILRIIMAFQMQGGAAIVVGITGAISIFLGALIYSIVNLPSADTLATAETATAWFREWGWVIGLFVALEIIVHGVALIVLALAAKKVADSGPSAAA